VQIAATERTPVDSWWAASDVPVLVVQPMQDVLAPAENAERLRKEGGDRVRVAYVDRAGHALLPEQPDAVASNILAYLRGLPK
jgi:pimeloyl-ACP methyl ester carboxylesterase